METIREQFPAAEMERAMRIQEAILKAPAEKPTWNKAVEIAGMSVRSRQRRRRTGGRCRDDAALRGKRARFQLSRSPCLIGVRDNARGGVYRAL